MRPRRPRSAAGPRPRPARDPGQAGGTANAAPTLAPANPVPANGQGSIVDIVKAVSPAVVTITADGVTATDPTTGQTGTGTAVGSGVIFDANGLVLTNHHVVNGNPSKLTVTLKDGRTFDASIYGIDTLTDLAIVKINGASGLPTAPIGDSSTIQVGQQAIAIGSPLGDLTGSVTSGIVSALGRNIDAEGESLTNLIQTDTADQPRQQRRPAPRRRRQRGRHQHRRLQPGPEHRLRDPDQHRPPDARPGLGRPAAGARLARHPVHDHRPDHPAAGRPPGRQRRLDPDGLRAPGLGGPGRHGPGPERHPGSRTPRARTPSARTPSAPSARIPTRRAPTPNTGGQQGLGQATTPTSSIVAGSPAAQAGLAEGDIITSVNGTALDATHTLDLMLSQLTPGQQVTLTVLRNGQTSTVTITLGTRPQTA